MTATTATEAARSVVAALPELDLQPVGADADPHVDDALGQITAPGARWSADVGGAVGGLRTLATELADRVGAEPVAIGAHTLTEREHLCSERHVPTSGRSLRGSTVLTRAVDGWVALNLARDDDRDSLPALTEGAVDSAGAGWTEWAAGTRRAAITSRARLLGLALGALPPTTLAPCAPFAVRPTSPLRPRRWEDRVVLDLSRLWAGPLAGALLSESGARVVRVVDVAAPPSIAPMDARFEERLHAAKETVRIDFTDRRRLQSLIDDADIVITAMRPGALARFPTVGGHTVHLAITAHGVGDNADRVGFGDDCAVEGGLVAWQNGRPVFLGDAIADPLTGAVAAVAALGVAAGGRGGRVDLSLSRTAAWTASFARRR